jgi:hypothetical protein
MQVFIVEAEINEIGEATRYSAEKVYLHYEDAIRDCDLSNAYEKRMTYPEAKYHVREYELLESFTPWKFVDPHAPEEDYVVPDTAKSQAGPHPVKALPETEINKLDAVLDRLFATR